jgi:redox-sensitive bicupin YhaK (pirin superfamily)
VSNLDAEPDLTLCHSEADDHAVAEVFEPRAVPLGGLRGVRVDRVMPQRGLPTVGAWCFLDVFGPHDAAMRVLPHPHTGLQTVTWPLAGEIHHRDSLGSDVLVRPGQLNLMTAGRGVAHSELAAGPLRGVQLWVALPADRADMAPEFEQHVSLPVFTAPGAEGTVLLGTLGDATSPATTHTPLVGADLTVTGEATLPLRPDHEHAVLVVSGALSVAGVALVRNQLLYLGTGRTDLRLSSTEPVRVLLLGGEPFPDELVMWWNFVGRGHDEIATARADWESAAARFGTVSGHNGARIPAPDLPNVRLTPRRRNR